ncbi:hypothetical protein FHG66_20160 [Rubellimicrobium rubrum]|uniref:Uncharacterized protein n=1 Tax=Rubellimicrobium rubrum TaxID=2585369 RepID=A0A5C4MJ98_9RHOB|nr:hypothetical protein [Rubellimicrobium rubrum]TNC45267.1 hypothetical protein FHG66_20160 [Rubellimicrobium rubrum]
MPPRPPASPTSPDADLRDTLDLLSQVVADISDRLDKQGHALQAIGNTVTTLATREPGTAPTPDRMADATARAVGKSLLPSLHKIVDAMEELNGTKAVLRDRWRIVDREEARLGRWKVEPWSVVLGIPLALLLLLALTVPRAVAQTPLTCRATGGTWWDESENYPAACSFNAD